MTNAIQRSWVEKRGNGTPLWSDELDVARWGVFLDFVCDNVFPTFAGMNLESHRFIFRWDTLDTLAKMLQESMNLVLGRAHSISCTIADATGQYQS